MQQPQPRQFDDHDTPDRDRSDLDQPDAGEAHVFRPPKFLIGLVLIAIALIWAVLDGTVLAPVLRLPAKATVPHGPVLTTVQSVEGVRVRPLLNTTSVLARHIDVVISFDNTTGAAPRFITPRDLRLVAQGRNLAAINAGAYGLRPTTLAPGSHVTGTLRFTGGLAPGLTLIYTPSWAAGHTLRWELWR